MDCNGDSQATAAEGAPIANDRLVNYDVMLEKPYTSRASEAVVDNEHPDGTRGYAPKDLTMLQQHVAFFDRNGDGIVYPWETYQGFRAIGFNPIISFLGMVLINGAFSYLTVPGWLPSPLFGIYIKNIHKAKHGSDSEVYDTEGRFVPYKFEEIFSKYAKTHPDRLSFGELYDMTNAMRNAFDVFGWLANKGEWGATFWLIKDEAGFASKEAIRGTFDGSFFEYVERDLKARRDDKQKRS